MLESLFNKVAGLKGSTLLKRDSITDLSLWNTTKILRTAFFIEHLWWLVLLVVILGKLEVTPYKKTPIQKGHQRNIKIKEEHSIKSLGQ